MTTDVETLRGALLEAIEADLGRPRVRRRLALPLALVTMLLAGTGVAAATGVIFAEPRPDPAVPAVPEWQAHAIDPRTGTGGPVEVRPRPEALARTNRATEAALRARGITARCGSDPAHPLACYLPGGAPVAGEDLNAALTSLQGADVLESSPDNFEYRRP